MNDTPAPTAAQTTRDRHEWYSGHHGKGPTCRHCGIESPDLTQTAILDRDVPCVWILSSSPAPTAASYAPITAAELDDIWNACDLDNTEEDEDTVGCLIEPDTMRRLITTLRSERAERDVDARAIVDFAKHCERRSLIDTHIKAIEAAKERVKR